MNSAEDRVRAAMTAAAEVAAREIPAAPPLYLPAEPAAYNRRRRAPRRWTGWVAPLTAAAVVLVLAVSLVLVKDARNVSGTAASPSPSASPAPVGPGGAPRYYAASAKNASIVVGDSVTGKLLATLSLPTRENYTISSDQISAADDDETFVVASIAFPTAELKGGTIRGTETATWYEIRLTPGAVHPARLTRLPIPSQTVSTDAWADSFVTAVSGSGRELAVSGLTPTGGLSVRVYSMSAGQLLHEWTTSDPSLSLNRSSPTTGIWSVTSLTWIDGGRGLAVNTLSKAPGKKLGYVNLTNTVRELTVPGPVYGDLVADSTVVWKVPTGASPVTLLQGCVGGHLGSSSAWISADGSTMGCLAQSGPGTDPNLNFLTYPLKSPTGKATVQYQITDAAKKGIDQSYVLWTSPSGNSIIGGWDLYVKGGALEDSANGLHVGVLSHGTYTPLRFPPGFDLAATVSTMTW